MVLKERENVLMRIRYVAKLKETDENRKCCFFKATKGVLNKPDFNYYAQKCFRVL